MEDQEMEENGFTAGEFFKILLKRIWWIIGAVALGILIVVLVTQLWYNKKVRTYSVSYDVVFPDKESGKYPDGSTFILADNISLEVLTAIKNGEYSSDENKDEFKSINVEKMVEKSAVSLSTDYIKNSDENFTRVYVLRVSSTYFKSAQQAARFFNAIANYPIERINNIVENRDYSPYTSVYENANKYEEKIAALVAEKQFIINNYSVLVNYDKSVESKLAAMDNIFTASQQSVLNDMIKANGYVLNTEEYKSNSIARKEVLNKAIEDNNKTIANLKAEMEDVIEKGGVSSDGNAIQPFTSSIDQLTKENSNYQNEIDEINKILDHIATYDGGDTTTEAYKAKAKFDDLLESYRAQLDSVSAELRQISKSVYLANSRVIYSGSKLNIEGGIGTVMSAVLGAVIGLLVSVVVVCIIDIPKYSRIKRAQLSAGNGVEETVAEIDKAAEETVPLNDKADGKDKRKE